MNAFNASSPWVKITFTRCDSNQIFFSLKSSTFPWPKQNSSAWNGNMVVIIQPCFQFQALEFRLGHRNVEFFTENKFIFTPEGRL
jgi:hypothetical protein